MKVAFQPQVVLPNRSSESRRSAEASTAEPVQHDVVNLQSSVVSILPRTLLGAGVLGGLGVVAGLHSGGWLGGIAGGVAGAAGVGFLGVLSAAWTHQEEKTGTIGTVAALAGAAGGAYLGASGAAPVVTAVALGAAGAFCGGFMGMMSYWGKD